MKSSLKRIFFKTLKITGILSGSILLLMFLLPYLFPDFVAKKIKSWANDAITTELDFSKARLSFFHHFPSLTLSLYDFTLKGSKPFEQDTLVAAHEIALGIDLSTIFSDKISINQIFVDEAKIHVSVNEKGEFNYNVYHADTTAKHTDSSSASLKIENIEIKNTNIVYDDKSVPMLITASGFHYSGKGDLSKAIFDLYTNMQVASFSFVYGGQSYISDKKLNAELITRINTSSLELLFQKNDLRINQLPLQFNGRFDFLKNGYDMDFKLESKATDLHDVFTALPPELAGWLSKTELKGNTEMYAALKGKYIEETQTMPDLSFTMKIRNGFISHQKSPSPVKNLFLNLDVQLRSLNTDSLHVNIDSIFFNIDHDYFSSILRITGLNKPYIETKINSEIDLGKWTKAFGIGGFDLKGIYSLHFNANGKYETGIQHTGIRKTETAITSIPSFNLKSSLTNGYFKFASLPQALQNISFNINAYCPDNKFEHAVLSIENINADLMNNFIKGYFRLSAAKDYPIDAVLQTAFHLSDIKQFYPIDNDSINVSGDLNIDISTKGKYNPSQKLFPLTKALLSLKNGSLQTKYYPHPLEKIQVEATVINTDGTMKSMDIKIKPVSFEFEGHPFMLRAALENFDDLKYDITSRGKIDVGKIYSVFALKGYDVKGFIQTDIALHGSQADAAAGRYEKLDNKGTMELSNIVFSPEIFPLPFIISTGLFRFEQDKMWFDSFKAHYGKSDITLNGNLLNVINYALQSNQTLKGNFDLKSNYILADEFMAFAGNANTSASAKANTSAGVIIMPDNLSLTFNAAASNVSLSGLGIKDFKGQMVIDSSKIKLNQTGFNLIGTSVNMDASYTSLSPRRAYFDYHISAKNFDIKRAYNEIKIFHDLATSASKAEGIVSLDYSLSGKLDENMYPVYPSLKGGGVLSLEKVKIMGLKLFSAVSKATSRDSLNNPNLSKVNIRSSIANNIITIERTKMRVFGFRPRFEGQVSFDGDLHLSGRLGLPPFGIFGIPFTVTGTQEKPIVKLKRDKAGNALQEKEDKEEDDQQ